MANYSGKFRLPKKVDNCFKIGYDPELGISPDLEPNATSYFQPIIGILRWMIKLERINIITKLSLLSTHLVLPREEHLDAAVHVMAW